MQIVFFINDLRKGKIKNIKDLVSNKISIPTVISELTLTFDNTISYSGQYIDGSNEIVIGNTGSLATVMHEITHASQYYIKIANPGLDVVGGGSEEVFKALPYEVSKDLNSYLFENFPNVYDLLKRNNKKNSFADVVYYLLQGELEANASLNSFIALIGFTYRNNRTILVSPDGKKTWSLKSWTNW